MTISPEILVTVVLAVLGAFWVLIRLVRHMDVKKIEELAKELSSAKRELARELSEAKEDLASELSEAKRHHASTAKSFAETDKCVEVMKNQISNLEKENASLRSEMSELRKKHEDNVDTLSDIRETIAGFGAHYLTRREYLDRED